MEKIKKGLNPITLLLAIGVLFLLSADSYSYSDLLRVPMGGKVQKRISSAIDDITILKYQYKGSEKEKVYYETIIGWVTYILENYKTRFGGNKLIFIGGACKRAYQAAVALCDKYGVNEKDIVYLDLPRLVHRRTGAGIIAQYLEERGLFGQEAPIAIFDNMVNSEGHYSTFGKVTEAIGIKRPQAKLIFYIMFGGAFDSYSKDFSGTPGKGNNINLTAIFMGTNSWMETDVRRERLILYEKKDNKIVPVYLEFKKLAQFLSEIKEGDDIFNLNPESLSKESRDILPLVQILLRDVSFIVGYSIDWIKAYKQLKALCESGSLQKADIQDRIFLDLLQQQRMQSIESVRETQDNI